mmetsp:Transcript_60895/g.98597  ORF Transcript_60895/g.98597 Transcript_60895/m.98597 type:complete len:230 (-) Transcript_60895:52-741(-)
MTQPAGRRGATLSLTVGTCPVRSGAGQRTIECVDHNCKVNIDQLDEDKPSLCYVGATQSFSGYGPWLCCNHAKLEGWSLYEREACQHCRYRTAAVNKHTHMAKSVKGVPEYQSRPTGGWSHGGGKAKKRHLLHSKRLATVTSANPDIPKSAGVVSPRSLSSRSHGGHIESLSGSPRTSSRSPVHSPRDHTSGLNLGKEPSYPSFAEDKPNIFAPEIVRVREHQHEFWGK